MITAVADAHLRSAVAGIRGLGQAGVPVLALSPRRGAAGLRSRFAAEQALVPDAQTDRDAHVEALTRLAAQYDGLTIYPASEAGLGPLLDAPLPDGVRLPFGNVAAAAALRDKLRLPDLAARAGLATPAVVAEADMDTLRQVAAPFPLIVKPALTPAGITTAEVVHNRAGLDAVARRLLPGDRVVVQEIVSGRALSLALVVASDGALAARFQERVLRTWPVEAGSFALTESEAPDPSLFEHAQALLQAAGYSGLAQLDVIIGPEGPVLLDANTRFYACLPTALRAGVNLPALWHAVETGGGFASENGYPAGVRFRWLEGDLSAAVTGIPSRLALPPRRPTAGAMWRADDPVASAVLAVDALGVRIKRRLPWR